MRAPIVALLLSLAALTTRTRAEACTMASECTSGFCVDGVCCDTECSGACKACSAARKGAGVDGTCGDVAAGTACGLFVCSAGACPSTCATNADCAATAWCSGTTCVAKKSNGDVAAAAAECTSGLLADGVCCDTSCVGVCESCDATGTRGTCTPVAGAPRHGACPTGADVCANATCDGVARSECKKFPGAEKECRASACDGSATEIVSARCDGTGACPAVTTKACGEYVCDGTRCRTSCRSNPDCASGFTCDDVETKKCLPADTCDGDHTIKGRNGNDQDCTPYKCDKTSCLSSCIATSQCTPGFVCNGAECVRSFDAPPEDAGDGGCAFGPPSALGRVGVLGLTLALLVSLRRRR